MQLYTVHMQAMRSVMQLNIVHWQLSTLHVQLHVQLHFFDVQNVQLMCMKTELYTQLAATIHRPPAPLVQQCFLDAQLHFTHRQRLCSFASWMRRMRNSCAV